MNFRNPIAVITASLKLHELYVFINDLQIIQSHFTFNLIQNIHQIFDVVLGLCILPYFATENPFLN